jgi:hypothetical protein
MCRGRLSLPRYDLPLMHAIICGDPKPSAPYVDQRLRDLQVAAPQVGRRTFANLCRGYRLYVKTMPVGVAPLAIHKTPGFLHYASHCGVGATQIVRVPKDQQQRAAIFRAALRTSNLLGFASATVHTSHCDRITRPICTLCQPIPAPDLSGPFL